MALVAAPRKASAMEITGMARNRALEAHQITTLTNVCFRG
jgi:hypothetical protein